jgi:fructosamine-3-kinase
MNESLSTRLEAILGRSITQITRLSGGLGDVFCVSLSDRTRVVAKVSNHSTASLELEAYMLNYLAEKSELPVPAVIHVEPDLLLLSFVPGESRFSSRAQRNAAELLAALHAITAPAYGLEQDTLIGGLHQPNGWSPTWLDFFREQRLLHMGAKAVRAGRLPLDVMRRLERFAGRLEHWLQQPSRPALIHGDVWAGNVLAAGDPISGFLDPAIYYADPEIELAFITLFNTFGNAFFARYDELRPIAPGFFEERSRIYNLYPLLVHVRLFGDTYVGPVKDSLTFFGS